MADRSLRQIAAANGCNGSAVNPDRDEEIARLLKQHERSIYAYILSLVPRPPEADEIFQETTIKVLESADESIRDFQAWACSIARFQVLKYRKRVSRDRLRFGEQFIAAVAAAHDERPVADDLRTESLGECVEKLSSADQELLRLVYREGLSVEQTAQRSQRTPTAIYKALARIRGNLSECIERTMRRLEQR